MSCNAEVGATRLYIAKVFSETSSGPFRARRVLHCTRTAGAAFAELEAKCLRTKEAPTEPFFRPPPTARFRTMSSGFSGGALPIRVTPKTGAGSSPPCSEPESEKSTRQGLIRAGSGEVDHSPANAPAEHVRHQNRINQVQRHEQRWPPITPLWRRGERGNGPLRRRGRPKTRHARYRFCDTCELRAQWLLGATRT